MFENVTIKLVGGGGGVPNFGSRFEIMVSILVKSVMMFSNSV